MTLPSIRIPFFRRLDAGRLLAVADVDIAGVILHRVRLVAMPDDGYGPWMFTRGPKVQDKGTTRTAAEFDHDLERELTRLLTIEYRARPEQGSRVSECRHCAGPIRWERGVPYDADAAGEFHSPDVELRAHRCPVSA